MSQLVVLAQAPTVKVGWVTAGVVLPAILLAVAVVVMVPPSVEQAQVEILKSTVPPGRTLFWETVMATKGLVLVGGVVVGGVVVGGVVVGVVVGGVVGDAELDALGDTQGELDTLGELDALSKLDALGELDKAMLVMPVPPSTKPVATPKMIGPECTNRIWIPL